MTAERQICVPGTEPAARPHRGRAQTESSRDDWQTPPEFVAGLRRRWAFVLDAACSADNAVVPQGLTERVDALSTPWVTGVAGPAGVPAVWCNPPYGRRGELARAFVARGAEQAREVCGPAGLDVVMLLAATPGVRWMHDHVLGGPRPADEVWFTRGRLAFVDPETSEAAANNPTASVLVVWRAGWRRPGPPLLGSIGKDGLPADGGW